MLFKNSLDSQISGGASRNAPHPTGPGPGGRGREPGARARGNPAGAGGPGGPAGGDSRNFPKFPGIREAGKPRFRQRR